MVCKQLRQYYLQRGFGLVSVHYDDWLDRGEWYRNQLASSSRFPLSDIVIGSNCINSKKKSTNVNWFQLVMRARIGAALNFGTVVVVLH